MLQLQVNHIWPQIGVNRAPARLEMQSPGFTLDISVTQPQTKIEYSLPEITIDQSQCFSEAGRKGIADFAEENASFAVSKMLESIGRIAEQGNALTDIQFGGNPIVDQSYYNAYDQFEHEFNMATIPKSRPKIEVIEGSLDIQVIEGKLTNNTVSQKTSMQYVKGAIEVYLKQRGSIDVSFVDVKG